MVLGRISTHIILVVAISLGISTLGFPHMVVLWENFVLIGQVDFLLALLGRGFHHLILDGLLDFLRLLHRRPCVSKVAPLEQLSPTLGVALGQGHRWLVTKEEVVLRIDVKVGRRALLLITVLCCIWLHLHHALAPARTHRIRFGHHLLRLGCPS